MTMLVCRTSEEVGTGFLDLSYRWYYPPGECWWVYNQWKETLFRVIYLFLVLDHQAKAEGLWVNAGQYGSSRESSCYLIQEKSLDPPSIKKNLKIKRKYMSILFKMTLCINNRKNMLWGTHKHQRTHTQATLPSLLSHSFLYIVRE